MSNLKKNYVVDLLLYVGFVLLLGTGLILHYILPHGSGRIIGEGAGYRASEKLITTLWGMTTENWGEIHFWIAVAVMTVMIFHLAFHWKWIICVLGGENRPPGVSGGRAVMGLVGMFGILAIIILPFLTSPEKLPRHQLLEHKATSDILDSEEVPEPGAHKTKDHDKTIQGRMTLAEIQDETGVPYTFILDKLGLPADTPPDTRLGRLRRMYEISIEDIRKIVAEYEL